MMCDSFYRILRVVEIVFLGFYNQKELKSLAITSKYIPTSNAFFFVFSKNFNILTLKFYVLYFNC